MVYQLLSMVLELLANALAGACLLRVLMQVQRVSFQQPLGRLVLALTDRLVLPLRRALRLRSALDVASVLAAWGVKCAQWGALWLLAGGHGPLGLLPLVAALGLAQLAVSALSALVLVAALLSWLQPGLAAHALAAQLAEPFLRPIRRWVPLVGGVDVSPIALLLVLQMLGMVLAQGQLGLMR